MKICDVLEKYSGTIRGSLSFLGGEHYIFLFNNGEGASVIRNSGSYGHEQGLYELAYLKHGEIIGDVEGYLTVEDVDRLLNEIKEGRKKI